MDARAALRRVLAGKQLQIASDSGQVITLRSSRSSGTKQRAETGVVTGQVLDPATGEYLRNATIEVESADGRRRTVASEEGGEYRVTDVPAGPVNLKISYTGYIDETASIKIVAGQTVRHDAALILSTRADQDAEIVVTAGVLERSEEHTSELQSLMRHS